MAASLYDKGREGILDGSIDMTGDIRVALLKQAYTFAAGHEFVSDLGSNIIARSDALGSMTYTSGVFDATDETVTAVPAGDDVYYVVLFSQAGGSDAARRLIGYIDSGPGLPFTPNGSDETIAWSNGANKIFKL